MLYDECLFYDYIIYIYPNKSPKPPASSSSTTTGFFSSFLGASFFLSSFFSWAGAAAPVEAPAATATAADNLGNPSAISYFVIIKINQIKLNKIKYHISYLKYIIFFNNKLANQQKKEQKKILKKFSKIFYCNKAEAS